MRADASSSALLLDGRSWPHPVVRSINVGPSQCQICRCILCMAHCCMTKRCGMPGWIDARSCPIDITSSSDPCTENHLPLILMAMMTSVPFIFGVDPRASAGDGRLPCLPPLLLFHVLHSIRDSLQEMEPPCWDSLQLPVLMLDRVGHRAFCLRLLATACSRLQQRLAEVRLGGRGEGARA